MKLEYSNTYKVGDKIYEISCKNIRVVRKIDFRGDYRTGWVLLESVSYFGWKYFSEDLVLQSRSMKQ